MTETIGATFGAYVAAAVTAATAAAAAATAAAEADSFAAETDTLTAEAMRLCAMAAEIKFGQAGRELCSGSGSCGSCGSCGQDNPLGSLRARMEEVARKLDERGFCAIAAQIRRSAE